MAGGSEEMNGAQLFHQVVQKTVKNDLSKQKLSEFKGDKFDVQIGKTQKCLSEVEEGEGSDDTSHIPKTDGIQPVDDGCKLKGDYLSIRPDEEVGKTVPNHQDEIRGQNNGLADMYSIRETKARTASQPYVTEIGTKSQTNANVFDDTIDGELQLDNDEKHLQLNGSNDSLEIDHERQMTEEVLKDPFNGLYKMQFGGLSEPLAQIAAKTCTGPETDIKACNKEDSQAGMMMILDPFNTFCNTGKLEVCFQKSPWNQKYLEKILESFIKNQERKKSEIFSDIAEIIPKDLNCVLPSIVGLFVYPVSRKSSQDESRNPSQEEDDDQHNTNVAGDDDGETRVSDAVRNPAATTWQGFIWRGFCGLFDWLCQRVGIRRFSFLFYFAGVGLVDSVCQRLGIRSYSFRVDFDRSELSLTNCRATGCSAHRLALRTREAPNKNPNTNVDGTDGSSPLFANGDANLLPSLARKNGADGDTHDPRAAVEHESLVRDGHSHECIGGACAKGCHSSKNAEKENQPEKQKTSSEVSDLEAIKKENDDLKNKLKCKTTGCYKERKTTSVPCGCRHFCVTCYIAKLIEKPRSCPSCGQSLQFYVP